MNRRASSRQSYPFHVAIFRLVTALVLTTALGIGVSTYRNTRHAVQQLSNELIEEAAGQTVARTDALLATAPPTLETTHWLMNGIGRNENMNGRVSGVNNRCQEGSAGGPAVGRIFALL